MADQQVWLVTGAARGMGVDIARAAHAAGHAVVATARDPGKAAAAVGTDDDDVLTVALDVTDPTSAVAAVQAVLDRFGRLDVLVNNAGNFHAGFFEELTDEAFRAQIETTFFGPVNVTRAALPPMRRQRCGLIVTISSTAGLEGGEFLSAYAASKFAVEGWMESLAAEVAPFGIRAMLVEPGFFRTELLTPQSTQYADASISDYAERTEQTIAAWKGMDGQQGGDPASSPPPWSSWPPRTNSRCASPPAPMPSPPSRSGPNSSSTRPTPTAGFPATSPTTRPEHSRPPRPATLGSAAHSPARGSADKLWGPAPMT